MAGKQRMARPSFYERLRERFLPSSSLKRAFKRSQLRGMREAKAVYDAAKRTARTHYWRRSLTDANAETFGQAATLRAVAHDLVRNNPYGARVPQAIANNMVGAGIEPQVKAKTKTTTKRLNALVKAHLLTTDIDADGRHNIYGLQNLMVRSIVVTGEVLVRRRHRKVSDGYALPYQLQVLEPDFLDTEKDEELPSGNVVVQGVEFDLRGQRVAYYIFPIHPGNMRGAARLKSHRVMAGNIAHVYRVDRPGQVRGVSWFAPVVMRLKDFADYLDAQLVRQKIAACFAAFVHGEPDEDGPLGSGDGDDLGLSSQGHQLEAIEPGLIEYLEPGQDVTFSDPPKVDGLDQYSRVTLQEIATGLGIPYTVLTGDLKGVNFSSGRMGWLEFQRNIAAWYSQMFKPAGLDRIGAWFLEAAAISVGPGVATATMSWILPRREMVNPKEEIAASKEAIRAGLSSRSYESRKLGHDPEELEDEIAQENERADDKGLKFDTDPRVLNAQGQQQPSEQAPEIDEENEDGEDE